MNKELIKKIEAILFVKGSVPTTKKDLISLLSVSSSEVEELMITYKEKLETDEMSALSLKTFDDSYKLVTKPETKSILEKHIKLKTSDIKISQVMMETLTIIAYAQPITRVEIDYIRGVESSKQIQKLMDLDLVERQGKSDKIGTPWLYGTTNYFLEHFGQDSITNLPEFNDYINKKQLEFDLQESKGDDK